MRAASLMALVALAACTVDVPTFSGDEPIDGAVSDGDVIDGAVVDGSATDAAAVDAIDAIPIDASDGLSELLGRSWSLGPGGEATVCVRVLVPAELWITEFHIDSGPGMHHAILTTSATTSPLGDYNCGDPVAENLMLFGADAPGDDFVFPSPVAIKVSAGQSLRLQIHVQNTTADPLTGRTAVRVKTRAAGGVEAEMILAGRVAFTIPSNVSSYAVTGGCTFPRAGTLIAFWPHMHRYGIQHRTIVTAGGTPTTLRDDPYAYDERNFFPLTTPISVNNGDSISVRCTYTNFSGSTLSFGETEDNDEQCFTGLYRYPKQATNIFECTN